MGGQNVIKVNIVTEYLSSGRRGYPVQIEMRADATVKELKAACALRNRKISPCHMAIRADGEYLKDDRAKLNEC